MSQEVKIYTTENCSYCKAAKDLLVRRNVPYKEILLTKNNADEWTNITKKFGLNAVPQIFVGEVLVGGFKELSQQDDKDQLQSFKKEFSNVQKFGCSCCR